MKFFFAGSKPHVGFLLELGAPRILESYWEYGDRAKELTKEEVFLDSGAFSAWSQKKVIDPQDYIAYVKKYKKKFSIYANLDIIGDAQGTLKNQKILEKAGLSPIPTFHAFSDLKYLHYYAENYPYIALGGLVPLVKDKVVLRNWLNTCFKELMPYIKKGLKVHGFGMSSAWVLTTYPFYSSDSTGWLAGAKFGSIQKWNSQKYKMEDVGFFKDKASYFENGADLKLMGHFKEREANDIAQYLQMEKDITKLWESRGITYT